MKIARRCAKHASKVARTLPDAFQILCELVHMQHFAQCEDWRKRKVSQGAICAQAAKPQWYSL